MEHYYAMIMAGGSGTRLWPMSRTSTPKQLLPLTEEDSMFKISVDRLKSLFSPERIYVVTGAAYVEAMQSDVPEIPRENFIVEPYGKDSGPAAALGIAVIHQRDPQAVVALLTADHHIADETQFHNALAAAYDIATQQGSIVTLGISPSFPSTGFGYIHRGEKEGENRGFAYYRALGFKEKPDPVRAVEFIQSGQYSWNSGMFIWSTQQAMNELQRQQPQIHNQIQILAPSVDTPDFHKTLRSVWEKIPRISLDYAVMENAEHISVIPVDIGWSDVGSWGALFDIVEVDQDGNCFRGNNDEHITIDTSQTFVYSDRLTVTVGIQDLVVIDTEDALLICHKDRTQDVKQVVKALKASEKHKYL